MEYIQLLSEAELQLLRRVLGCRVPVLYTRAIEVQRRVVVATNFSMHLGENEYCVIESDWNDTPNEYLDYHSIHVELRDWPKRIARVRDDEGRIMLGEPSTIHLPIPTPAIVSVAVHESRQALGSERVHYDHALVFTCVDGYRFSLAAHQSIRGGLEFSDDSRSIEELARKYRVRISLAERGA